MSGKLSVLGIACDVVPSWALSSKRREMLDQTVPWSQGSGPHRF